MRTKLSHSQFAAFPAYRAQLKENFQHLIDELPELTELQRRILKERWLDQVIWMEGRADQARNRYTFFRLTVIIGGILVPVLVTLSQTLGLAWFAWVATALSTLIAMATAIESFFHYGERWRHYRNTVELLKMEGWSYFQLTSPHYKGKHHAETYAHFAARVEAILLADVDKYVTKIVAEQMQQAEDEVHAKPPAPTDESK